MNNISPKWIEMNPEEAVAFFTNLERENVELMKVFKAAKALVDYDIEGESTHWPESNQKFEDLKAAVEARKEQP